MLENNGRSIGVLPFKRSLKKIFLIMKIKVSLEPNPIIEAYKKDLDTSLLLENLKRTPTERVEMLMEMQRMAEELSKAGKKLRQAEPS